MRLTIFRFLIAGYLTIMLLVLSFGSYVAFELNHLTKISHLAAGVDSDIIQIADSLSMKIQTLVSIERKYWISKDKDFYQLFIKRQNEFLQQLDSLQSLMSEIELETDIKTVIVLSRSYFKEVQEMEKKGNIKTLDEYASGRDRHILELLSALEKIEQAGNLARDKRIRTSEVISKKVLWITIFFAILCIFLSIIVSFFALKRIVQPIVLFQRKTRDIAAGKFVKIEELHAPFEICQLADEFNSMSMRLQELDRLKEDFISHMSHTLRTPLTAIQEASEMLKKGIFDNDHQSRLQLMEIISNECKRLIMSVNRILDLSRMESKMMDYRFIKTDLNEVILTALSRLSPIAQTKKIELSFSPKSQTPMVMADSEQLHQLLENLIGNALKYTDPGGSVTLDVKIPEGRDTFVQVLVTDTGRGIELHNLQSIFDKFRRIEGGKDVARGSGLGLAIAQHIVKAHGGSIWVESEKGVGSTFYFSLPPV